MSRLVDNNDPDTSLTKESFSGQQWSRYIVDQGVI